MRQWLADRDAIKEKDSWRHLRETLGFKEAELRALAQSSRARRHGDLHRIEATERIEHLTRARRVVTAAVDQFDKMRASVEDAAGPQEPPSE